MQKLMLSLFALLIISTCKAQTIEEIKSSDKYIWGEATARNLRIADNDAINDLISQISISVQSDFTMIVEEQGDDLKEYCENVIKTYSQATLHNAERKVEERNGETYVLRYLLKEDKNKIFESRKLKIKNYAYSAFDAEEEGRIADALKYYYWSLVLLRSHPENNSIKIEVPEKGERLLITTIPDRLNRIFSGIRMDVQKVKVKEKDKLILLNIAFNDKKTQNLDYIYWTGDDWSSVTSSRDGLGIVEYYGAYSKDVEEIKLRMEYEYISKANIDRELQSVIDVAYVPFFRSSELRLPLVDVFQDDEIVEEEGESGFFAEGLGSELSRDASEISNTGTNNNFDKLELENVNLDSLKQIQQFNFYKKTIHNVCRAIAYNVHDTIRPYFTNEGWEVYEKLIKYGNAKVIDYTEDLKTLHLNKQTLVRSIPMRFDFKANNRKFIENVSFTFDNENKINDVTFSLGDIAINDIMSKSDRFANDMEKALLINFMETYKTAYCLGRADYLDQIFADDALIIVGRVLKKSKKVDGIYQSLNNDDVEYIKVNKHDYINRLRRVFESQEFVNIQFEDNIIKKARADSKIYGIQIKQYYYSTNYGDVGYLFLMIDLEKIDEPQIYVRTWQPKKNADGSIYGLKDFVIN